jgi:hypothetical protein
MNNYYILPKINNKIQFKIHYDYNNIRELYISQTLINYYCELKNEIILLNSNNTIENFNEIINPYEYIFSTVPGSNYSVSKLKPKSMMFYDLFEIFQNTNILETYNYEIMNSLVVGTNYEDSLECLEMLRENYINDKFFCFHDYTSKLYNFIENNTFNFVIYEVKNYINMNHYVILLLEFIVIIINNLQDNSNVIIKINNLFYKPVIEILYVLSSLFEKTIIVKPNTSNIINFDKYIVLQKFKSNQNSCEIKTNYMTTLNNFIKFYNENNSNEKYELNIHSVTNCGLPYYFLNKIDDINIIIGQQQLETFNQIINLLKNSNKDDKIELLKKNNIQKSVNWCEKYKIPCNKFSDKINIFLPLSIENPSAC